MGKHTDAVKTFAEFRAPWETEDGTEADIDKPKLKRYLYNLVTDKAKAQDAREESLALVDGLEKERDEAKDEAAKASPAEAAAKIEKLEKKIADLTSERDTLKSEKEKGDLRAEVLAGVDPKLAKYVTGATKEELEKSLEAVKADFGVEEEEGGDDESRVRTQPRPRLKNGADAQSGKGGDDYDFDKLTDEILGV